MRSLISTILLMMTPLFALAQEGRVIRGNCMPDVNTETTATTRAPQKRLTPMTDWDAERTYRQAVVLISFKDTDFSLEDPRATYDSIFNYPGFNRGKGPGCVAEYFREQSGGMLNLQFDVYGPYKVSYDSKRNPNATKDSPGEMGREVIKEATELWLADDTLRQHKDYAWNGNKIVNQVIYVYAGFTGNQDLDICYGRIWPNTGYITSILSYDGYWVGSYSCSGELAATGNDSSTSWGIGTICHEFTHSLGLPDIYPTRGKNVPVSVVDEWDLMDGGNFTNRGWCPPNYSGLERMLLGWQSPIELTEPTTITDMKPLSDGGPVYMIRHTDKEYYLLENRQWSGWDTRLPGRGLAIFHVDYNSSSWSGNSVNIDKDHFRYDIIHADGLDYNAWSSLVGEGSAYYNGHSRLLSTSAYPWATDSTEFVNNMLTDISVPASLMFNINAAGSKYLSKAITNITMTDDGLVSFDFMGGSIPESVSAVSSDAMPAAVYNLRGVCVGTRIENQRPGIYIIRYTDGTARKVVVK